jgi:hypothetical protein
MPELFITMDVLMFSGEKKFRHWYYHGYHHGCQVKKSSGIGTIMVITMDDR